MPASSVPPPLVVVVAYRADDHLDACLTHLGTDAAVVVVDNDPAPTTHAIAERHGATYRAMATNVGFAAAVNVGLQYGEGRDVLLLNPDARVNGDDLQALQRALREPSTHRAAVGPRLVDDENRDQLAQWPMPSPAQVWLDAVGLSRLWRGRMFVVGAALLLHADALADLGGLDERYFLYAEEADWQLRAQRAGWSVAMVGSVTCTHAGGASSGDPAMREGHFVRSANAFALHWYGPRRATLMRAGSVVAAVRRSVIGDAAARAHNRRVVRRYLPRSRAHAR